MTEVSAQCAQRDVTGIRVVAAAVVREGRLLLVSKQAAPDVFYLPGGKPEPGETPEQTLLRELEEELGAAPVPASLDLLAAVEDQAALEDVPMRLTIFRAALDREPSPEAELAELRWAAPDDLGAMRLAPAVTNHVVPLLTSAGALPGN